MNNHYASLYNTPEWESKRKRIMARDDWRCVLCGSNQKLNVHHLKYGKHPASIEDKYLETLCQVCHDERHEMNKEAIQLIKLQNSENFYLEWKYRIDCLHDDCPEISHEYVYKLKSKIEQLQKIVLELESTIEDENLHSECVDVHDHLAVVHEKDRLKMLVDELKEDADSPDAVFYHIESNTPWTPVPPPVLR